MFDGVSFLIKFQAGTWNRQKQPLEVFCKLGVLNRRTSVSEPVVYRSSTK